MYRNGSYTEKFQKVPKSSIVKIVIIIRHEKANLKDTYKPINTKSYIILYQKVPKTFLIKLGIVRLHSASSVQSMLNVSINKKIEIKIKDKNSSILHTHIRCQRILKVVQVIRSLHANTI